LSSRSKLIAGTVVVAALAAGGAAFAAMQLTSSSPATVAPAGLSPFGRGIGGSGLGGGRLGGRGLGGGLGGGSGGFRGGFGGRGFFGGGTSAAASYLGLTATALRSDLLAGKTLAQVAKSQGKSVDGLVAAMVSAQKKRLDTAVSSGVLTEEQAQQIGSALAQRMKDLVNGVGPRGFGGGLGDGQGFGQGAGNNSGGGSGSFGSTA
jgi:Protein of unknown function (DUF2680)